MSKTSNRVFVLNADRTPLMPCHPARARELLRKKRAAVYRIRPFTIILLDQIDGAVQHTGLGIDPGTRHTGMALITKSHQGMIARWGMEIEHRGGIIRKKMESRATLRSTRRHRKTRYRPARFNNRATKPGWLPPSLESRVSNTFTWVKRLMRYVPLSYVTMEVASFDLAELKAPRRDSNPYRTTQMRHWLLHRYSATCQYCLGLTKDRRLQWDHVVPRSKGGTDSTDNATLACSTCNQDKSNYRLDEWLTILRKQRTPLARRRIQQVSKLTSNIRSNFKDPSNMNRLRGPIYSRLCDLGLPIHTQPGWHTAHIRNRRKYPKTHWIDAACVAGDPIVNHESKYLSVHAIGWGNRQMQCMDRHGFPRTASKGPSRVFGYRSGDIVQLNQTIGKYKGIRTGTVVVRTSGKFDLLENGIRISSKHTNFKKLQCVDGFR